MSPKEKLILALAIISSAGLCGFIVGFFTRRMPMSGRVSLTLLCLPLLSIVLLGVDFGGDALNCSATILFAFSVPVCLFYSFRARRLAPDRRVALAGFAGSILFSLGYLIGAPQILYELIRLLAGGDV